MHSPVEGSYTKVLTKCSSSVCFLIHTQRKIRHFYVFDEIGKKKKKREVALDISIYFSKNSEEEINDFKLRTFLPWLSIDNGT